ARCPADTGNLTSCRRRAGQIALSVPEERAGSMRRPAQYGNCTVNSLVTRDGSVSLSGTYFTRAHEPSPNAFAASRLADYHAKKSTTPMPVNSQMAPLSAQLRFRLGYVAGAFDAAKYKSHYCTAVRFRPAVIRVRPVPALVPASAMVFINCRILSPT